MLLDAGWHTNLPRFQGARPDHACESKVKICSFPRGLVSFDQRFPPIGKRISKRKYDKKNYKICVPGKTLLGNLICFSIS